MELVPDFVTTFTEPAELLPWSRDILLVSTENSCTASGNGNGRFVFIKLSMFAPPSKLKWTLLFRDPLTENSLVPRGRQLLVISPWLLLNAVTPVASSARSAALRPLSGNSTTRARSTVSLIVEERTSTCDAAASTETTVLIS